MENVKNKTNFSKSSSNVGKTQNAQKHLKHTCKHVQKIKSHAKKVGNHMRKHHKKYVGGLFAGFALFNTVKVIIALVGVLMSLQSPINTRASTCDNPTQMEEICKKQKLEFDKNSCGCVCGEGTIWDCDENSCVEGNAYCKKLGKIFDGKGSCVCDKGTEQVPGYSNCVKIENQDKSVAVEKSLSIESGTPLKIISEVGYVILGDGTQDTTITALKGKDSVEKFEIKAPSRVKEKENIEEIQTSLAESQKLKNPKIVAAFNVGAELGTTIKSESTTSNKSMFTMFFEMKDQNTGTLLDLYVTDEAEMINWSRADSTKCRVQEYDGKIGCFVKNSTLSLFTFVEAIEQGSESDCEYSEAFCLDIMKQYGGDIRDPFWSGFYDECAAHADELVSLYQNTNDCDIFVGNNPFELVGFQQEYLDQLDPNFMADIVCTHQYCDCCNDDEDLVVKCESVKAENCEYMYLESYPSICTALKDHGSCDNCACSLNEDICRQADGDFDRDNCSCVFEGGVNQDDCTKLSQKIVGYRAQSELYGWFGFAPWLVLGDDRMSCVEECCTCELNQEICRELNGVGYFDRETCSCDIPSEAMGQCEELSQELQGTTHFVDGSGYYACAYECPDTSATEISCLSTWNNDNFLSGGFWAQNPTDENIICALYGGGPDDTTAYTEYWSGWNWGESCDVENMTVVYTGNLPNSLNDNTVYVLTNGTSTSTTPISNNCVAIVSRNGTYFNQSILFGTWFYSILDNVSFSGAGLEIQESRNDTLNNIQSYNNQGDGILVNYSSNIILNKIRSYNNIDQDYNGAGIALSTLSNSRISNIETYGNSEGVGIYEISNNNFIDIQSYDNLGNGISLYNSAYNVFNNIRVYDNSDGIYFEDNWGGNDTLTYSNILSNVQSYNNSWYGIRINGSSGNVLNNIQSYNNGAGGINMGGEFNALNNSQCYNNNEGIFVYGSFILNNVQAYNNSDGIAVDGTGVFNNVRSYNNRTGVFFEIYPNSHSNVTYYGEFRTFANDLNNNSFNNCSRATNGIQSLGWQQGQYIDAGIMSWNFITNPIDVDGDNLLNWAETMFPGLQGPQFERDIDNYSYGSGILLQKQPVMWNGSNIVATGTYDSGKFIGSNSTKLYGDLLMSDPEQSPFYVTGIAAGSPSFSRYSVFGDFSPWSIDKNINTRSSLMLGSDTDKLVVQIHNTNDEYTHFQKDLAILRPISCLSSWNNDNYLNSGFWNSYAGNNQTGHQQVICALYGSGNGDRTAYTEHWTGWDTAQCPLSSMNVIETSSLGGNSQLADNTIYVLTAGSVNGGYRMGKCSAIVSKVNGGTTLNFNDGSYGVYSSGDNNIIFDNLNILNWSEGIVLYEMDNATLHNLILSGVGSVGIKSLYMHSLIADDVRIYHGYDNFGNIGIEIHAGNNVKINNVEIEGFEEGIAISKTISCDIKNSYIYNNANGIIFTSSTGLYLNNLNVYNNRGYGISVDANDTTNVSINNTQVYNYGKNGIHCENITNFALNNVQVYNGDFDVSHYGLNIKCTNVKINNVMAYGLGMGLYIYDGTYYGNLNSFGNVAGDNISYMTSGSAINSNGVNWSAGSYSTNGNLSWDMVTNPVAGSTYMLDWTTGAFVDVNRGYLLNYNTQKTTAYSYGSGIKTQQQPVMWSGNTLVATGTYDSSKYIGSDVVKLKGALQVPSPIQSNTFYATGVDNGTPIFNKYSLFGNKTTANANINKGTRTQVTMNSGADFLVTQIYQTNSGNFATHFEKSAAIQGDTTPPTINITGPSNGCATGKTIKANVTDTGDGVNFIRYIKTGNTTCSANTFAGIAGTAYTNNSTINLTSSDNNKYVCFKAVDNAGNTAYRISNQITGIVGNTVSFGTATLLSPTNGAYTGIHTPRLTWSGISTSSSRTTDPCSELSGYVVQICRDINCTQIIQTSNVLPLPEYTAASLNDGKYYRRVKGINKAGIAGAWSSVWNFTVDTIAPNCTFSRQPSNTNLYVGGTGTFSVTCTDTNGIDQSHPSVVSVPSGALSFSSPSVSVISGYEYTYTYTAQSVGNAGITFNADSVRDPVGHPNGGISTATSIVVGDACGSWDNDNYLNASFWREQELTETMNGDNSRKDAKLICALYGGGPGDQTAYTKYWSGYVWGQSCDVANMRVVRTGTLPNILEDNTVYVLTTNATFNATTNMSNCSAVVGRTTWSWQNVITREHPTVNGYGFSGSQYNILDNLEGVNSHVSVGSDSTLHDLSLHGTSMCGNSYIGSIATIGNGNFVDDITIYIVGRGIQVKSNRNIIMNVDVYNFWDYGIHIPQGYGYNQFNNIHIHDSADEYCATDGRGIEFEMTNLDRNPTEGDTFNNMNIHNNKYGIMYTFHDSHQGGIGSVDWWNRFSFNNIQVYNNKSGGIYIGGLRNSVLNNVSSYNNGGYGIYSTNSSNKYYGVIELTGNNSSYAGLSAGSENGILGVGVITGMILNWNYITNPRVASGYVLEWTKDYAKLRGPIYGDNSNRTGYLWLNEELQSVIGYSYGIKTKTQTQPMKYNGNTFVYSDLPYDPEAYIGSNVKKINGTAEISCYQSISSQEEWGGSLTPTNPSAGISMNNSVSLCSNSNDSLRLSQAVARYPMACSVTGHSDNPTLTPKYSVFGLLSSSNLWVKTGVDIGTMTGDIPNGSSSDTNNIVTQIWGSNYFATHFVGKNDNSCSTIPNTPTLVSPADESFLSSNSVSFSWNAGSVTCGTLSQYEIKICSGSCSTTTVTTNTYSTTLSDGDYTWSVREKDSEGNRSNRTSVRSFTIKTSLTCNQSWNNDNFLSGGFWSLNPTDDAIICALYGSGQSDKTAYTKGWSGFTWGNSCNVLGMDVVHTNTLPTTLSSNTIYVLETGKVINNGAVDMANCSAIVSKSGSVLYSIDQISGKGRISIEGNQYAILDNFGVDGRSTGGTMLGIYLSGSNSVTLNNVSTYNCVYGVYLRNGSNNILNNIQAYNNTRYGVSLYSSINNTLNNAQIYNNSQYGLAIANGSNNIFNNVQSYNNLYAGITLQSGSNNNTLNNIKSFNNGQAGILLSSSNNNKYYGELSIFGNSGTNGNDVPSVGLIRSTTANSSLGRTEGQYSTIDNEYEIEHSIWNYITNPKMANGKYMLEFTGNRVSLRGVKSLTGEVDGYSYGKDTLTQQQPVVYNGTSLIRGGSYAVDEYVGGQTKTISGVDNDRLVCGFDSLMNNYCTYLSDWSTPSYTNYVVQVLDENMGQNTVSAGLTLRSAPATATNSHDFSSTDFVSQMQSPTSAQIPMMVHAQENGDSDEPSVELVWNGVSCTTGGQTFVVTGTFTEAVTGVVESTLSVEEGSVVTGSFMRISGTVYRWQVRSNTGNNVLEISINSGSYRDLAGNTGTASNTLSGMFDNVGPSTPGLQSQTLGSTGYKPTFTWTTPSDNGCSSVAGYEIQICSDNACNTVIQNGTSVTTSWSATSNLSKDTRYFWRVRAKDALGNYGSWTNNPWNFYIRSITFNKNGAQSQTPNGGSASTATTLYQNCITSNGGSSCSITSPTITAATNFTPVGYNTSSGATTSAWSQNASKNVSASTTYYAITKKEVLYTATFNTNCSTSVGNASVPCTGTVYNGSTATPTCTVTAPSITRNGWNIIGWNTSSSATTAGVGVGEEITLSSNATYYAITSKTGNTYTATFQKNGATSIGSNSLSCTTSTGYSCTAVGTTCTVIAPSITRAGWNIIGWNTSSSATTAGVSVGGTITLGSNATYYAITSKGISATFKPNGNKLDGGTNDITKNCTNYNQQTSCDVTTPAITNAVTTTVVGYTTTTAGVESASIGSNTTLGISGGETYYAHTKKSTTATYKPNGNKIDSGTNDITKNCTGYDGATTCNVTTPTISNSVTQTVIGYSTSSTNHTSSVGSNATHSINIAGGGTWYAQTKKDAIIYTATYTKDSTSVSSITGGSTSCNIGETYNGTTQATSCNITLGGITCKTASGYGLPKWNTSNDPSVTVSISSSTTFNATCSDTTKPTVTLSSTSNLKSTSQTATLKCTDGVGVTAYYWGTTNPTAASSMTTTTASDLTALASSAGLSKTITAAGTYYLGCRDAAGNWDKKSVTIYSYTVYNMQETCAGSTTSYNTSNYAIASSGTYIAPNGTTLTLASIYTAPTGTTFTGMNAAAPSSSTAILSNTAPTLSANSTYSMWFARNTNTLTLTKNTGVGKIYYKINGSSSYSNTTSSTTTNVKYGCSATCYGEASTGYTMATYPSSSPWSTTSMTSNQTCAPTATANTYSVTYNKGTATAGSITVDGATTQYANLPKVQNRTYPNASTLGTNNLTKSNTDIVTYTVTLSGHGGTPATTSRTTTRYTGYTANGWTTTQGSTTRDYANGASFGASSTSNLILYPCFTQTATTPSITLPGATRAGYTFMGWSTASNDTGVEYASGASYTPTGDTTLYAVWKKTITITFNVNGNGGSNSTKTCDMWNNATSCSITSPSITCNNNTPNVIGWNSSSTTHSNSWTGNTSKNVSANATYYAQCKSNQWTYTATYKTGVGASSVGVSSNSCNTQITYNGETPTQSCTRQLTTITCNTSVGYSTPKFNGSYDPSSNVILTSNTIFTGTCSDTTAPTCSISTTSTEKSTSQTATLSCTDGVGVTKYYWGTSASPTDSAYTAVTSTTNYSTTKTVSAAGTYYLIAKDAAGNTSTSVSKVYRTYSVQNILDKVSGTQGTYTTTHYETTGSAMGTYVIPNGTTITLNNSGYYGDPISSHDTYKGYSTTALSSSAVSLTTSNPSISANTTYYRFFDRDLYDLTLTINTGISTIYYKVNGASSYSSTTTSTTKSMKAGSTAYAYAVASTCYTCENTCKNSSNPQTWTNVTSAQTYSPTAIENTNNITYGLNGGINNSNNPATYTIIQLPITLSAPTKIGYTFMGWTGSNGSTAQTSVTIAGGSCGDKTYNAKWQANTYKISYTLNNGSHGSNHPTTATYDTQFIVNNPTRNGYTFSGWKITGMDGVTHTYGGSTTTATGISRTTATTFKNLTSVSGNTVNFEALWIDDIKPVCTWGTPSVSPLKKGATGTIVLTCTDGVGISTTSLSSSDITLSNSYVTLSNATVGGTSTNRTFTFTYTAVDNVEGSVTLTLPANKVKDTSNNYADSVISSLINVDSILPSITLTTNAVACQKATTYTVTGTFSEAVTGLTQNDLTVTNGSIQSFAIVSSTVAVWTVKSNTSGNGTVTVSFAANKVTDLVGNGNTAATNVTWTYDNAGPTFTFANNTVNECTAGSLSITNVAQVGCAVAHSNPYSFDGNTWNSTSTWSFSTSVSQPGSGSKTAYVRDALGNITSHTATWTISNVEPTASSFTLNSNVGNTARTGNWKTLSSAAEGNCGNGDLTASVVTNGSKGSCSINGNIITYTPNSNKTGSDSCVIRIKDNENSTIDVTVSVAGIDTVAPTCTIAEAACTSGALRLILTASETINTPSGWTMTNGTTYYKDVTSNTQVTASISDAAGNEGSCNITPSHYDVQAPSTPTMNTITSCQTGTSLTVSSTSVSDTGCNGTVEYQFCKSTTNSTSNCSSTNVSSWSSSNSATFGGLNNGTKYYFFVRSKDGLGNTSNWSSSVNTQLDNTAPTTIVTGLPSDWTGRDVTLTLSAGANGCNSINTIYYCVYDSGSSACNPTTQGTSVSVTCNNNTVCQKYVRYYSKDGLGNEETIQTTNVIKIDKKKPTCGTWTYNPALNSCTTGNVTGTLSNSTDLGAGINVSGGSCSIASNGGTCNVSISDKVGNQTTCTSSAATNIDHTAPTVTVTNVTGYECSRITGSVSANDPSPACGSLSYSWNGGSYGSTTSYGLSQNTTGTQNITVKVKDSAGNVTTKTVTYTWLDVVVTGHDFTGSTNVGNSAKTANWMTSSEAAAGSCETISYVSKTNGSHGTCTVNENNVTYTPNSDYEGDDSCTITITDGDTNKTITVTWKNIDTKKPECSISANTTSCTSGGITLSMNTTGATKYSWTGFNSLVTTNTNKVVRANGSYNGYVQDGAGNTGSCSINVNNYDNQAPTVTVTNVTGYECEKLTGSVSASDPSPACGSLSYSWNGGSYGSTTSYGISQTTTGTQNITVKVKDSAGNETTETVTYTWFDKELTMTGTYDLGLITSSIVIPDLTAQNVFNVTGYGSCESVTIITGSCTNATMSLNGNGLTITPTINVSGIGNCTVGFTDGDTTKTGTITFTVQTLVPNVEFSGTNGAQINPSQSCINRNRFIAQMAVTNTPDLGEYRYDFDGTSYSVYDSGLILMYNFDNVSALGESATVVKDMSNGNHTGTVNSATWTSNGMRGGAYSFAGNSSSYIRFTGLGTLPNSSIVMWLKPDGGNWKHVAIVGNTIYVDGISSSITNNFIDIQNGYIGRKGSSYFKGQIDEVRVYNRALSQDEVQFLYRSNLSKINTGDWLFEVLNTCLDQTGVYSYTGYAKSLYTGEQSVGQTVQTCIPDLLITGGMDVDFGTYDVSETGFTIQTGYTTNVRVEDWIGRNGWTGSVRISSTFSGQNTTASISSSNFKMRHGNSIQDLGHYLTGIIPEINNGLVSLSSILSDYNNIQITGGAQGTPYFVPNYPAGDFMCNGGIYADKPSLQLDIPAWQIGDTYKATVYWTIEPQ